MAKLSKAMQAELDKMCAMVGEARAAGSFEQWWVDSDYCGHSGKTYDEKLAEREARWGEGYVGRYMKRIRKVYDEALEGIAVTHANSNTLKALERRGIIEVLRYGGTMYDRARLLAE